MEPISMILLGLLLGGAAATGIYIAYLTLTEVLDWFRSRMYLMRSPDVVATTIVDLLDSGDYETVQGVFNTRTQQWVESRTVKSDRISSDLAYVHRTDRVVIHYL